MKSLSQIIALFLMVIPVAAYAADGNHPLSSLPSSIYMITEPAASNVLGSSIILQFPRGDKNVVPIFSSKESAEAFLRTISDAAAREMSANLLPRNFARMSQKNGSHLILDPVNKIEGGTPISVDADKASETKDNPELQSICHEDQADRKPLAGNSIDWNLMETRDAKRLDRVKELYHDRKIVTGPDFLNAALVLQHGRAPGDFLLAHEFALVAMCKGQANNAKSLAALSEDRFLMAIGRKQRFGSQMTDPIVVDGEVTDGLREELGIPPLAEEEEQARSVNPPTGQTQSSAPATSSVSPATSERTRQP